MRASATALSSEMVDLIGLHGLSAVLIAVSEACRCWAEAEPENAIQATAYTAAIPFLEGVAKPLSEIGL